MVCIIIFYCLILRSDDFDDRYIFMLLSFFFFIFQFQSRKTTIMQILQSVEVVSKQRSEWLQAVEVLSKQRSVWLQAV